MFSLEQIKTAHSKMKSGADFPIYINDITQLGVIGYETYVSDGHTVYYGENNFKTSNVATYDTLTISQETNADQFKRDLKAHQQGLTNYTTFCKDCATSGIEKWTVIMDKMTCTYYDKSGNEILVENVPTP